MSQEDKAESMKDKRSMTLQLTVSLVKIQDRRNCLLAIVEFKTDLGSIQMPKRKKEREKK